MPRATIAWKGSNSIKRLLVPVDECTPHPDNPRRGNLDLIAESLETYGQLRPILRQKGTNLIVAGNHTYRAAVERLEWNRIAAVDADLDDEEARRYLLMDNRSSDVGAYDDDALIKILSELAEVGKLAGTGYDTEAVDDLIAQHGKVAESAREQFHGGYSETEEEIAERQRVRSEGATLREVVLAYPPERYEKFQTYVRMLAKDWGSGGAMDTIFEAVERCAKIL